MLTIFEKSRKSRNNFKTGETGTGKQDLADLIPPELIREYEIGIPELSENEVIRHFTALSLRNYGIDNGTYPLGSCTMKYNPKVNEEISNLKCFTDVHPCQNEEDIQGCLEIFFRLGELLKKITGLDEVTFQPSAGAHGEVCGLLIAKKYFKTRGEARSRVIIPDSAHGTNFASAGMAGFGVTELKSDRATGTVDIKELKDIIHKEHDSIALVMITNPNTLGIFENGILQITDIMHKNGSLLYYDGANLNAIIGKVRPVDMGFDIVHLNLHKTFSTPHGGGGPGSGPVLVKEKLKEFLPVPVVGKRKGKYFLNYNLKNSIGRLKAFYGNFPVLLKAYCYLLSVGCEIKTIAEDSVLNAGYLKSRLQDLFNIPYSRNSMHEFVISVKNLKETGANA
ncbi:MAG: aminotransferase class V-fold PLP-dependent enzyme, partial [Actinobacteria bacterium]|nr:aminotransferase class V-fold PLP-dependent enzyme [Actinomycetota bacterium]